MPTLHTLDRDMITDTITRTATLCGAKAKVIANDGTSLHFEVTKDDKCGHIEFTNAEGIGWLVINPNNAIVLTDDNVGETAEAITIATASLLDQQ